VIPATAPLSQQTRHAWVLALLLCCGSVVNYLDRAVLGVLMQPVRAALSLSNTDYGFAVNTFLVAYAVFYVVGGRLADRFGYRRTISISLALWSLAAMAHGWARGFASLCLVRGLLGAGQGSFYPAAIRGTTEWFPGAQRAMAIGLLLAGLCVGTLITPPVAAWLFLKYGWRAAFLVTGAISLLLLPLWSLFHRPAGRGLTRTVADTGAMSAPPEDVIPLGFVLRSGKYWSAVMARALSDSAWYFYLFWLPGYFQEVRGFDAAMLGESLWIPYGAAGLGALGGPWAAGVLIRRGVEPGRARKTVLVASACGCVLGALAFLPGSAFALVLVCLALFAHLSWATNIHTVITEISPPGHTAVLYGISGATGTVLGAVAQPIIGWIVDTHGYTPAFLAAGSHYVLAAVLVIAGVGRIERIKPPPQYHTEPAAGA